MGVQFGKIFKVGKNEELQRWAGPETTVIDLQGQTLLPGFIDTPAACVISVLQILGLWSLNLWLSPVAGIFFSVGITAVGLLLVIGDFYLARFFYHIGIRYLKWNIAVITGTEVEP